MNGDSTPLAGVGTSYSSSGPFKMGSDACPIGEHFDYDSTFEIGIIGEFSGHSTTFRSLRNRRFISVTRDTVGKVLAGQGPSLEIDVPNEVHAQNGLLRLRLRFGTLEDFNPERLARQIGCTDQLCETRDALRNTQSLLCPELEQWLYETIGPGFGREDSRHVTDLNRSLAVWQLGSDEEERTSAASWVLATAQYLSTTPPCRDTMAASLAASIEQIDALVNKQISHIIRHESFIRLERLWRGLELLLMQTAALGPEVRVRILNASLLEISLDFAEVPHPSYTVLWRLVVDEEFDTFGGRPFNVLILDDPLTRSDGAVELLENLSLICGHAHTILLTAVGQSIYTLRPNGQPAKGLAKTPWFHKWRSLSSKAGARYICAFIPRVRLQRPPSAESELWGNLGYPVAAYLAGLALGHAPPAVQAEHLSLPSDISSEIESLGIQTLSASNQTTLSFGDTSFTPLASKRLPVEDLLFVCRSAHALRAIIRYKLEGLVSAREVFELASQWFTAYSCAVAKVRKIDNWAIGQISLLEGRSTSFEGPLLTVQIYLHNTSLEMNLEFECFTKRPLGTTIGHTAK